MANMVTAFTVLGALLPILASQLSDGLFKTIVEICGVIFVILALRA